MNTGEYEELIKEVLGDEYMDYNLVMASTFGLPLGDGAIRKAWMQNYLQRSLIILRWQHFLRHWRRQ